MLTTELLTRRNLRFFTAYVAIGGAVFCVDVGLFALLVREGRPPLLANVLAFGIASAFHFTLNRNWNFRNFDRPVAAQARTYGAVVVLAFSVSNAMLIVGHALGLSPLAAKLSGNVLNLPLGFLAHRYLTFDRGIFAAGRRFAAHALGPRTREELPAARYDD
jgi:putative flippase GtrA